MVDTLDLGSSEVTLIGVRLPSPVPKERRSTMTREEELENVLEEVRLWLRRHGLGGPHIRKIFEKAGFPVNDRPREKK